MAQVRQLMEHEMLKKDCWGSQSLVHVVVSPEGNSIKYRTHRGLVDILAQKDSPPSRRAVNNCHCDGIAFGIAASPL